MPSRGWVTRWSFAGFIVPAVVLLDMGLLQRIPPYAYYIWPTFWMGFALESWSPFDPYNLLVYTFMIGLNFALYFAASFIVWPIWRGFKALRTRYRYTHENGRD